MKKISELIQTTLNTIFNQALNVEDACTIENFIKIKSLHSAKGLASKLGISEPMLSDFEVALRQYFQLRDQAQKGRISCFRVGLFLDKICKNLEIPFSIDEAISNEELAIKQVRALELVIRAVVNENLGGKENALIKLQTLFKEEVVQKWLQSADETGILSGTTFSELSGILLDKNIFKSIEEIFENSELKLTHSIRDSLRYILEDIRLIRNSIAHNKQISKIQIEALNEYYRLISNLIREAKSSSINPDAFLDLNKATLESFVSGLKEDNRRIETNLEGIKNQISEVGKDAQVIRKRTLLISAALLMILAITGTILYFVKQQTESGSEIAVDIKEVKEIVSGDAELKNMTSTDDLKATKELNARTKNANAKRLAIIYFDNSGGEAGMEKLKKGLADMLITDLSNVNMLAIVEREKLEEILKEQKLNNTKEFDPNTATKVGKLLGAQVILTGGYFEMMGSLRIDARFIDVESGKILKSDGVDGVFSNFFKIQKQLSWKIIKNMDVKITESEKKALAESETSQKVPLEMITMHSEALDLFDSKKLKESKMLVNKILAKYPDFKPAKNLLQKL
jgi:TolB-like protein